MTETDATAEVFWTAFRVLSRKEQQAILRRLLKDKNLRQDLYDLAIIESRRREPTRPLRDYLAESRRLARSAGPQVARRAARRCSPYVEVKHDPR